MPASSSGAASKPIPGFTPERKHRLADYLSEWKIEVGSIELHHKALCHRSFANEQGDPDYHFERLELLGDAVAGLVAVDYLFRRFTQENEGAMSAMKGQIVSRKSFLWIGRQMDLDSQILVGTGERQPTGKVGDSIVSNCAEALVGAIYLDLGLAAAQSMLEPWLAKGLERLEATKDYKSLLNRAVQKQHGSTPVYRTANEEGPAHERTFQVEVIIEDAVRGSGEGSSKQAAQQAAARVALESMDDDDDS